MIEHVLRGDDPRTSDYAHVGDPAWLQANGLFVAEGRFVVQRLLAAPFRVRSVLVTPTALNAIERSVSHDVPVFVAPQDVLASITGFTFHRGCLALAERPSEQPLPTIADAGRVVVMEGIANPDNVGGLFRVAAAFGVEGVLLDGASADPLYRKAIRTSMGAVLSVPFVRSRDWPAALGVLRDCGYTLLALTPRADATPIQEIAQQRLAKLALLVGAEGEGLSDEALRMSDLLARIPMAPGVDSLNVTVAAGIALHATAAPWQAPPP